MRIHATIALISILLPGALGAAAPEEKWHRKFMPGTKITLLPRKAKYLLGENILLDYRVEYNGEDALALDSETGLGSPDCTVVALDADGKKAPTSTREFHGTGQGGRPLRRGDSIRFTIPLSYYCRLEKPGKYRIRAAHNLYWTDRNAGIAEDDPRWAETTIEVVMPDDARAARVVEQMLRAEEDVARYQAAFCTWTTGDYADFACLRYPVYIPILEKMAADAHGDKRALLGIAHNPAPEATQALLRLLKTPDKERLKRTAAALCDRLPEPKGSRRPNRRNPIRMEEADPDLVKPSWREDFAAPMRQFARKALADDDLALVRCAAYVLEAIGVREDVPDLVATLSRLVPLVERARPPEYWGAIVPVRQACMEATCAVEALAARGVDPKADPRTPGEIVQFVSTVKQRKSFRPEGWEKRCRYWVENGTPYVLEFVLFNTPRPLPSSLVDPYTDGTRRAIATTLEPTTLDVAVRSAVELNIAVDELLGMLVDRMDPEEPELYADVVLCLGDLLKTGRHDGAYLACVRTPEKNEMVALKARWKRFLRDEGPAIRKGKRFDPKGSEFRRLISPDSEDGR